MEFNPYSIPPIISLAAIFTVGLLVWRYNPTSTINQSFMYFCFSTCFWLLNFSIMYNCKNQFVALFWAKIGFIGVIFIPITGYIFTYKLLHINLCFIISPLIKIKLNIQWHKKRILGILSNGGKNLFLLYYFIRKLNICLYYKTF